MKRILILGASGYMGRAFLEEAHARGHEVTACARREVDYTRLEVLQEYLRQTRPDFLINAAGYAGLPNVDACEVARAETLLGNVLLPQTIAHACLATETPWLHISTGCLYDGAFLQRDGGWVLEKNLSTAPERAAFERDPSLLRGFAETDAPNFSFRQPPCSFFGGSKALAEEAIANVGRSYVLRLRMPFDQFDSPRNLLTKLQRYPKLYDNFNSISHRGDFARAGLALWERSAPYGLYHVTNPGFVSTRQIALLIERFLQPARAFAFWENDEEFYRQGVKAPRTNCVLDTTKLAGAGIQLRPVEVALEDSLRRWHSAAAQPPIHAAHL